MQARSRRAFTLVELLVVIGIFAVLIGVLVPVIGRARRQAKNVHCLANLRSLDLALVGFVGVHRHSVEYAPVSVTNAKAATNLRSLTWEGALRPYYANDSLRLCPEAADPSEAALGTAFLAHGTRDPISPPNPEDTYSFGSYGINGFLYYQSPSQPAHSRAGLQHAMGATAATMQSFWFDDITTAGSVVIPLSVTSASGLAMPSGFGDAGFIPAFGDCVDLDAWPASSGTASHDPTPSGGGYTPQTGDYGNAKGHSMGRFCLNRHPGGVNLVFLDGHAETVHLPQLWQLRWNKSFVPVQVTIP